MASGPVSHGETAAGAPGEAEVRLELERVLQSPPFRSSKRSQQFLRYVVEQALGGHLENLKERVIGMEVFERKSSYDTSEDATVRVTANEVRKRLAQCYLEGPAAGVRIQLPAGSYVPEFSIGAVTVVQSRVRQGRVWMAVGVLALAVAGWAGWRSMRATEPFERFWAPLVKSPQPVLVCLANPMVFVQPAQLHPEYRYEQQNRPASRTEASRPRGPLTLEVMPMPDQYVGAGDAYASSGLLALFAGRGKATQLRISNDISFADLRSSPAVLIGAYSNRWTMQMNKDVRFAFDHFAVIDRAQKKGYTLDDISPDYRSAQDYAIVTRLFHSHTGESMVAAGGITQYGTQSAAEFLTKPEFLDQALKGRKGWEQKNLQILIHCRVTGATPGPPEVVAVHVW